MNKLEEYKKLIEEFHVWKERIDVVMENGDKEWDTIIENIDEDDEWAGCVYGDINYFLRAIVEYG
jgi:coenzyme F420-reducing hydrogenase delta subunit